MITLADIRQWAAGIAESQGTATDEEETIAHAIRHADKPYKLRPLSEWACFRDHGAKHGPFPWRCYIEGPGPFSMHADSKTFSGLAASITAKAADMEAHAAAFATSSGT